MVQRQVEPEEEDEIQPESLADAAPEVTPEIGRDIRSIKGAGQPLSASERAFIEPRFGVDFYDVHVHSDAQAAHDAHLVNARAFTLGKDVVFGAGQYAPGMSEGRRLLAHELTHVVQQSGKKLIIESGTGLMYLDPEYDRYTFESKACVDCQNRLDICKVVCCKFPFALSRQDVEEGIIHWEFGRPYLIAHDAGGYCVHLDRKTYKCTVYDHRTVPCRGFDCRENAKWKVWQDYEKRDINPELVDRIDEEVGRYTLIMNNNK